MSVRNTRIGKILNRVYAAIDIKFSYDIDPPKFINLNDENAITDCSICYFFDGELQHMCVDNGYGLDALNRCGEENEITFYKPMSLYLSRAMIKYKKSRLRNLQNLECEDKSLT